jgi:hypothetical protein
MHRETKSIYSKQQRINHFTGALTPKAPKQWSRVTESKFVMVSNLNSEKRQYEAEFFKMAESKKTVLTTPQGIHRKPKVQIEPSDSLSRGLKDPDQSMTLDT